MKREFLRGLGIEDALIDRIMGENGKDVEAAKGYAAARAQELSARDTEIADLKAQLAKRDGDMEALKKNSGDMDAIRQQLTELQAKYQADTNALTKKLQDQKTEFDVSAATEKFFSGVEFSSPLARDAAISQFKGKGFKLDNGVFQGGREWLDGLKTRRGGGGSCQKKHG